MFIPIEIINYSNTQRYDVTGKTLFHEDRIDNISQVDLLALAQWSDETKRKKLECITDAIALNLLEQMHSRNPLMRPLTAAHVLEHPFFTGRLDRTRLRAQLHLSLTNLTRRQANRALVWCSAEVGLFHQLQS